MRSFSSIEKSLDRYLQRAWSTLGLPFSTPPLDESDVGIIDPEVAILLTLAFSKHVRVTTDVPAWISSFSDLLNHGKIRSLLSLLYPARKDAVLGKLVGSNFEACPKAFKRVVGLKKRPETGSRNEIEARARRIRPVDAVSESCTMIRKRLLFGTGFRADLICVIQAVPFPLRINQLASLIGCAESTASRIISDLHVCGYLNRYNQMPDEQRTGHGLFMSADSLRNASKLFQANRFESKELRESVLDEMDLRFDGLFQKVVS